MKTISVLNLLILLLLFTACSVSDGSHHQHEKETRGHEHGHEHEHDEEEVRLTRQQFDALGMKVDTLSLRAMRDYVETNGQLTLPPQSKATVTAIIGTNIHSVEVIEGNKVTKGQPLAYLSHPNIIQLQTEYVAQYNRLKYLKAEFERQEKLFEQSVAAGKEYQRTEADYRAMMASVKGLEAQLHLLHVDTRQVLNGKIYETIPLRSPITGFVQQINVNTGQFVEPQDKLFEITRNDHIHAHFKVFESDIHKVREGQTVQFIVESQPEKTHWAVVFAVGKTFEPGIKAVNVHAELENESESLLPGMYARGQIILSPETFLVIPQDGLITEGDRNYIFMASTRQADDEIEWHFKPLEVSVGVENDGWVVIKSHHLLEKNTLFAHNNAYYLMAEMNKEEAGHDH